MERISVRRWPGLLATLATIFVYTLSSDASAAQPPENLTPPTWGFCGPWCQGYAVGPGTWTGTEPITISHRWERCAAENSDCSAIPGATGPLYYTSPADVGRWLRFVEIAENAAGRAAMPSPSQRITTLPTRNVEPPFFVGEFREGNTVRLDPGVWQAWDGTVYEIVIQRCDDGSIATCEPVKQCQAGGCDPAAPDAWRYTLTAADVGKMLWAWVFNQPRIAGNTGPVGPVQPLLLALQAPLGLDRTRAAPSDLITGTVTWRNPGGAPLHVRRAAITMRRPGATRPGGPFDDFAPIIKDRTVAPGATLSQTASLRLPDGAPAGTWEVYPTWQDATGTWHDNGNTVLVEVDAPPRESGDDTGEGRREDPGTAPPASADGASKPGPRSDGDPGAGRGSSGDDRSSGGADTAAGHGAAGVGGRSGSGEPSSDTVAPQQGQRVKTRQRRGRHGARRPFVARMRVRATKAAWLRRRRGVRVRVTCSNPCLYELRLIRGRRRVGAASGRLARGTHAVPVRLHRRARDHVAGGGSLRINGVFEDAAGTERRLTARVPIA